MQGLLALLSLLCLAMGSFLSSLPLPDTHSCLEQVCSVVDSGRLYSRKQTCQSSWHAKEDVPGMLLGGKGKVWDTGSQ